MNEQLFARLAARLAAGQTVILASVLRTRGATPRKAGARMLIGADWSEFSIGGGLAEARVMQAARALLPHPGAVSELRVDLSGGADSAGVCGGSMQLALCQWSGAAALCRATAIASALTAGQRVPLSADDVGHPAGAVVVDPDPRLLIIGGGHCGLALYELARYLDFELWVFDPRAEFATPQLFPSARVLSGDYAILGQALTSQRALYGVLLNRDFASDVASLAVLAGADFAFLGMMGSARRIATVLAALSAAQAQQLARLQAPVGLAIGAQTPHEIAVSVLAHVIQARSAVRGAAERSGKPSSSQS